MIVAAESIRAASESLRGVVVRTPLLACGWIGDAAPGFRGDVRLKCENLQRAGAFKIRGAYTLIARLSAADRSRGVITYSSGNHAQGVALAARLFGVPAVVVMPTTAPAVKVEGAKGFGAEVILEGTTSTERQVRAQAEAAERGLTMVPPFDHPDIIAGQGSVGVEILEDWPDVETVVVPIGGGGLASGVAAWVKAQRPACRIIGVEPIGADAMRQSCAAGRPVTIELQPSIADGLMPVRPGDLTFQHMRDLADDIVTVNDEEILAAATLLLRRGKLVVEFSGAATFAALLAGRVPAGRTAVVLSGGNLDAARALALLADGATAGAAA
jgi:threonine dehydratase